MALERPGRIAHALRSRVVALTETSGQWRRNRPPRPAIMVSRHLPTYSGRSASARLCHRLTNEPPTAILQRSARH